MISEMQAVGAAISSAKAAYELTKAILDGQAAIGAQAKVIELQKLIMETQQNALEAQAAQSALIDVKRELEKEIMDIKAFESEKVRYRLTELRPGVVAYCLKEGMEAGDPPHNLCASCYNSGVKSFLQAEMRNPGRNKFLICHSCGSELIVEGSRES